MTPDTPPARQQRDEALPFDATKWAPLPQCPGWAEPASWVDGCKAGLRRAEAELKEARNDNVRSAGEWAKAESRLSLAEALLRRCSELSTECHPSGALCDDIARFLAPPRDGPGEKCGVRYLAYGNPCVLRAGHDGDHFYAAAALASLTPAAPGAWGPKVGDEVVPVTSMWEDGNGRFIGKRGRVTRIDSEGENSVQVTFPRALREDAVCYYRPSDLRSVASTPPASPSPTLAPAAASEATVRVRIAVALYDDDVVIVKRAYEGETAAAALAAYTDEGRVNTVMVEADVPVPEAVTVEGAVTPASAGRGA